MRNAFDLSLAVAAVALAACSTADAPGALDAGDDIGSNARHHDAAPKHEDAAAPKPDAETTPPVGLIAVPMTSPDSTFWGPQVTVGTQTFLMDLDTGSTTIGVAGSACTTCKSVGVSPLYAPTASATDEEQTSSTEYEDGTGWSGEIYKDAVALGDGAPSVDVTLVDISKQTKFFVDNTSQGILGMGAPQNAEPNTGAYFSTVTTAGVPAVMAFELCDTTGTMWLGGFDATKSAAAPQYTPLIPITTANPFYSINIDSMSIGTTSVGSGSATFEEPVVDTGTTLFYVPTAVDKAVLAAINASPGYKALFGTKKLKDNGCITTTGVTDAMVNAQLPPLTMTMPSATGGADISVSVPPMLSYLYDGGNGQFCYAMGDGGTQEATTMGDSIMRAFVTVIDVENQRVGWAPDTGCASAVHAEIVPETFHPRPPRPRPLRH